MNEESVLVVIRNAVANFHRLNSRMPNSVELPRELYKKLDNADWVLKPILHGNIRTRHGSRSYEVRVRLHNNPKVVCSRKPDNAL